jgi:Gly-Xaa carboxypeptidase
VELLLEGGYEPTRSLVIAHGFDEECGGKVVNRLPFPSFLFTDDFFCYPQGAMALGKHLEKRYGKDSMLMLVDEGSGLEERYGQVRLECVFRLSKGCKVVDCRCLQMIAEPATAEKGYLDVELSIATPGGHSSVPRTSPIRPLKHRT